MLTDNWFLRIPLLADTLFTILLFVTALAMGFRLLQWLRVSLEEPLEQGLFAITLGLGALCYVPFALFSTGLGSPQIVAGAVMLLFVLLLRDTIEIAQSAWRGLKHGVRVMPKWGWALVLALLPQILVTLLMALCPPTDPDGLIYHLAAPQRYLQEGRFVYMPTFLHVHWPLGIEMLFAVGLAIHRNFAAGMIQFGIGLTLMLAVFALGRRVASPVVGALAAAVTFFFIRAEMSWAYIDLGVALYLTMTGYALYLGAQELAQREAKVTSSIFPSVVLKHWQLAALCAGLTATAKLPGLLTIGLVALLVFGALWAYGEGDRHRLSFALGPALQMFGIGMLLALPWLIRCWVLTGAPVYPYFGGLFHAKDWSPEWQKRLNEYFQVLNSLRSQRFSPEQILQLRALTTLALAALGVILYRWRGARPVQPLIAFLFASLALQVATSGVYLRFLLPMFPMLLVIGFWLLRSVLERPQGKYVAVACVIVLLWRVYQLPDRVRQETERVQESLPVALGSRSRDAYLAEKLPLYTTARWCNMHLPSHSVVTLGLMDAYSALFTVPTLTTHYWTQNALRFDSAKILAADLKRLGATHLIIQENKGESKLKDMGREDYVRATQEFPKLAQICAEYGKRIRTENGYGLYALKLP